MRGAKAIRPGGTCEPTSSSSRSTSSSPAIPLSLGFSDVLIRSVASCAVITATSSAAICSARPRLLISSTTSRGLILSSLSSEVSTPGPSSGGTANTSSRPDRT